MKKLVRITTVPISLEKLLENQLQFMKQYFEVIAVSSDEKALQRVGKMQDVPVFAVEMTRKITPLKDLKALLSMYRFFKREKPFIVHSHTPKAGTIGMLAAKMAGVPHRLHTVAGLPLLEATGNKRKLLDFVEKLTYSCATAVYPNSFGLKEIIEKEKFCEPNKLKVIGKGSSNGINTSHFSPELFADRNQALRQGLGIHENDFVFIFVGRLVGDKGINELVAAFAAFKNKNVRLLLVGALETELDPLSRQTLEILAGGIENNFICVGFQPDVRPYFAISDALVFPSYREGFPNVVLQAAAMGLPVIATDINGCNEIIKNGVNGVLIPVKDAYALQSAMENFLEDKQFTRSLAANARKWIVDNFEQTYVWNAIADEYKKLEGNV